MKRQKYNQISTPFTRLNALPCNIQNNTEKLSTLPCLSPFLRVVGFKVSPLLAIVLACHRKHPLPPSNGRIITKRRAHLPRCLRATSAIIEPQEIFYKTVSNGRCKIVCPYDNDRNVSREIIYGTRMELPLDNTRIKSQPAEPTKKLQ